MARWLKIQGVAGPKLLERLTAQAGTVQLEPRGESLLLTEDAIKTSQEMNEGSLVLFADGDNVHAFDHLAKFCRTVGLKTYAGDTDAKNPADFGKTRNFSLSATDIATSAMKGPDGLAPENLVKPSTYFSLLTPRNIDLAIKMATKAKADMTKAKEPFEHRIRVAASNMTPQDMEKLAIIAENMSAANLKRTEAVSKMASISPDAFIQP